MTEAAIVAAFVVVLPAIWLFVTMLIAALGGWDRIAQEFPDDPDARLIRSLRMKSLHLGHAAVGASYNGVITVDVCETGLRFSVWRLFGPFSKPFFLRWEQFRTQEYQWFIWPACRIRWGSRDRDSMIIYRKLAEIIAVESGGAFGSPDQGK